MTHVYVAFVKSEECATDLVDLGVFIFTILEHDFRMSKMPLAPAQVTQAIALVAHEYLMHKAVNAFNTYCDLQCNGGGSVK